MRLLLRYSLYALKELRYWSFSLLIELLLHVFVVIITTGISKAVAFQKRISFTFICFT